MSHQICSPVRGQAWGGLGGRETSVGLVECDMFADRPEVPSRWLDVRCGAEGKVWTGNTELCVAARLQGEALCICPVSPALALSYLLRRWPRYPGLGDECAMVRLFAQGLTSH